MSTRFYALQRWIPDSNGMYNPPSGCIDMLDLSPNIDNKGWVFTSSDKPFKKSQDCILLGNNNGKSLNEVQLSTKEKDQWNTVFNTNYGGNTILDYIWNVYTDSADTTSNEKPNPLIPTHKGNIELYFEGKPLIIPKKFQETSDDHKQNIINWEKENLKREYNNAELETDINTKKILKEVPNKMLGNLVNKYRLDQRYIIPDELKNKISAKKPTTFITDNFDRADDSTSWGSSSEGWSWSPSYYSTNGNDSTTYILSNRAYLKRVGSLGSSYVNRALLNLSSYDHYSKVYLPGYDLNREFGVAVWANYQSNFYGATFYNTGYLDIWWAGNRIYISSSGKTSNCPSPVKLERTGSTLNVYTGASDTLVHTMTHTGALASLRTGVSAWLRVGTWYYENFEAGDLLAGSPGQHYSMMMRNK